MIIFNNFPPKHSDDIELTELTLANLHDLSRDYTSDPDMNRSLSVIGLALGDLVFNAVNHDREVFDTVLGPHLFRLEKTMDEKAYKFFYAATERARVFSPQTGDKEAINV